MGGTCATRSAAPRNARHGSAGRRARLVASSTNCGRAVLEVRAHPWVIGETAAAETCTMAEAETGLH